MLMKMYFIFFKFIIKKNFKNRPKIFYFEIKKY